MPGNNAAQRVVNVLKKVDRFPEKGNVSETLTQLIGPIPEGQDTFRVNANRLEAINKQIDATVSGLQKLGFPDHLTELHVKRLRTAFSPHALNTSWVHVRQHVPEGTIVAFEWAAYALDEDGAVDDLAMQALIDAATDLLNDKTLGRLHHTVRDALRAAIEQLINAARLSEISGVEPVAKAYRDLVTELETESEVIVAVAVRDADGPTFAQRVGGVTKKAADALAKAYEGTAKHADKVDKIAKLVDRGRKAIAFIAEHFDKLPPPGSGGAV